MIFQKILLVSLAVATASAAPTDTRSLDYILANLTSLWEEVSQLKREVNFHVHNGDMDHDHDLDKTLDEVAILAHEHHVHHLKHPHEGHNAHHNDFLLQHLETSHGHGGHDDHDDHDDHGSDGGHSSHAGSSSHGSSSGHGGRTYGSSSYGGGRGYDSGEDDDSHEDVGSHSRGHGRTDGLVDNCGDRGRRGGPGGIQANCGDKARGGDLYPGPSPPHRRGGGHQGHGGHSEHGGHSGHSGHSRHGGHDAHDMHDDSHEDDHNFHGLNFNALGHVKSDARHYEHDHYVPGVRSGDLRAPPAPGTFVDDWEHAYCNMMPNSDVPESQVRGKIDISQRIGGRYGVFFDIDVHGLDLTRNGKMYSVHVHERSVDGQRCDTAGGYNRPSAGAVSDPVTFGEEHAGNIGTFTAEADGEIDHEISASIDVTFDEMIGKAIVVHSQDKTRLACCNIVRDSRRGRH